MTDIRTQIGALIDAHISGKDTKGLAAEIAQQITVSVLNPPQPAEQADLTETAEGSE